MTKSTTSDTKTPSIIEPLIQTMRQSASQLREYNKAQSTNR